MNTKLPSTANQQEIVDQYKFTQRLKKAFKDGLKVDQESKYNGHGGNDTVVTFTLFGETIAVIYL